MQNLIDREVRQLVELERAPQLSTLVAPGSLESALQLSRPTIARYLSLLEEVHLIKRVPGWSPKRRH